MAKSNKFYAVKKGRKKGVYQTWDECQAQTHKFSGAVFKSFKTLQEAQDFIGANSNVNVSEKTSVKKSTNPPYIPPLMTGVAIVVDRSIEDSTTDKARDETTDSVPLKIVLYFDGASRGNPGLAGSGAHVVITRNDMNNERKSFQSIRHFCGKCTNNIAEYTGLIEGLKEINRIVSDFCQHYHQALSRGKEIIKIEIRGDSNLVINQMNGIYAVKNEGMSTKYQECNNLISSLKSNVRSTSNNLKLSIKFEHIYRNHNCIADGLANEAIDAKRSWITDEEDV